MFVSILSIYQKSQKGNSPTATSRNLILSRMSRINGFAVLKDWRVYRGLELLPRYTFCPEITIFHKSVVPRNGMKV
jgi:hypothetical protein